MRKSLKLPPLRVFDYSPDITLTIRPHGREYEADIRARDDYFDRFPISMTPSQVGALNTRLRIVLQELVCDTDELSLPPKKSAQFLQELASVGSLAFKEIFRNRLTEITQLLKSFPTQQPASLQIVSEDFSIPWELMFEGNSLSGPQIDGFWGTTRLISRIVVYPVRAVSEMKCDVAPTVGLVADHRLESVSEREIPFFLDLDKRSHIRLRRLRDLRPNVRDQELRFVSRFFRDNSLNIAHFACHATWSEDDPYSSAIEPPVDFSVSCQDIENMGLSLQGSPLVFLNACETGNVRPEYALFFSKQFLQCGARAVVATHCEVPDRFASAFAERFYRRFLDGEPAGASLLATRRAFAVEDRNPLGLVYGLFGPPNIRLMSRLTIPKLETKDAESEYARKDDTGDNSGRVDKARTIQ